VAWSASSRSCVVRARSKPYTTQGQRMGQMPSWSSTISLAAEPTSASKARDFVCLQLLRHGLRHLEDDLRLVVSELVTNAITHAQTPSNVLLQRDGPG